MKCPKCFLENPSTSIHCDCGYNFETKRFESSMEKSQTNTHQFRSIIFGSKKGKLNFWIGVIAWVGWFLLSGYQYMQLHEIVDPSYNPWDDGPLQISLSIETIKYIAILGPACLIAFPFGFWSWWRMRTDKDWPHIFDVIGCFLTGGFLIYPCGLILMLFIG